MMSQSTFLFINFIFTSLMTFLIIKITVFTDKSLSFSAKTKNRITVLTDRFFTASARVQIPASGKVYPAIVNAGSNPPTLILNKKSGKYPPTPVTYAEKPCKSALQFKGRI